MQVFIDGELIGGSEETLDLLSKGQIQDKISKAKGRALPQELREVVDGSKSQVDALLIPVNISHSPIPFPICSDSILYQPNSEMALPKLLHSHSVSESFEVYIFQIVRFLVSPT